jgi:hypothetical protein
VATDTVLGDGPVVGREHDGGGSGRQRAAGGGRRDGDGAGGRRLQPQRVGQAVASLGDAGGRFPGDEQDLGDVVVADVGAQLAVDERIVDGVRGRRGVRHAQGLHGWAFVEGVRSDGDGDALRNVPVGGAQRERGGAERRGRGAVKAQGEGDGRRRLAVEDDEVLQRGAAFQRGAGELRRRRGGRRGLERRGTLAQADAGDVVVADVDGQRAAG